VTFGGTTAQIVAMPVVMGRVLSDSWTPAAIVFRARVKAMN
jgi:hypothetical protein